MGPARYGLRSGDARQIVRPAFDGLDLKPGNEQTALAGEIRDQSHLYGVLDLVRALGLQLVSVETDGATSGPGDEGSAR